MTLMSLTFAHARSRRLKVIKIKYPKLQTLWKRDQETGLIIEGEYSKIEFSNIDKWLVSEKVDGTNIRCFWSEGTVEFRGRTDRAQIPTPLYDTLVKMLRLAQLEKQFGDTATHVILFGEGIGNKIQAVGRRYTTDNSFVLFDVWIDGWWLEWENVKKIADALNIPATPYLGYMTKEEIIDFVKSKPKSRIAQDKDLMMEGIVAKSHPLMLFRNTLPMMFKLKCRDYIKLSNSKKI